MLDESKGGAKVWYIPDGYLPAKKGAGAMESHEALMLLNVNSQPANVKMDIYFEDREPEMNLAFRVDAQRIKCIRMDHLDGIGAISLPRLTQYSLRIRSDVNLVVQFGRLDVTQPNLAYYGCMAYSE